MPKKSEWQKSEDLKKWAKPELVEILSDIGGVEAGFGPNNDAGDSTTS